MSTRIVDLPDQGQPQQYGPGQDAYSAKGLASQGIISLKDANQAVIAPPPSYGKQGVETTAYMPINMHPNPYGAAGGGVGGGGGGGGGGDNDTEKPMYRLQSHDIPASRDSYVRDERVIANYIEEPRRGGGGGGGDINDYVRGAEKDEQKKYQKFREEKHDREQSDIFIDKMQKPLLAMLLFLILQLPIWNIIIYKYLSPYLYVCNDVGEIVFTGMLLKTVFFGAGLVAFDEFVLSFSQAFE